MTENDRQTQDTPPPVVQPSESPNNSGRQKNVQRLQKDNSRHPNVQGHVNRFDRDSEQVPQKHADSKEDGSDNDEDEGTDSGHSSRQQRFHRGGRPEKRIIEESINDPYCE